MTNLMIVSVRVSSNAVKEIKVISCCHGDDLSLIWTVFLCFQTSTEFENLDDNLNQHLRHLSQASISDSGVQQIEQSCGRHNTETQQSTAN